MRLPFLLCLPLLAFALAGCDVFGGRGETVAYGRVVDATNGQPLAGFRVAFVTSSGGGGSFVSSSRTAAFTTTGADGRYRLAFQYDGQNSPIVYVNKLTTAELGCFVYSYAGRGPVGRAEPGRETEVNVSLPRNSYFVPEGQPTPDPYPAPVQCR
jgi:hypothetical protein